MTKLFEATRSYIEESFNSAPAPMRHFDRTVYWLQQLQPDADEALLIAAIGHDIERAFRASDEGFNRKEVSFTDPVFLKHHQETGAQLLSGFLKTQSADRELIEAIKHLVSKHEVGGDDKQNLLMDADSISFLENQAQSFIDKLPSQGYEKVREKIDWMYERMVDEKAKLIARPLYEDMIKKLDEASSD